ncbi:hypothetical protein VTL71DRAFT_4685 [Oculimacula yallundae]|uniref:Uncharacterized protein n=1 Tax=Oculimacula yallundae TaxID=86028 RepID=A0ABR4C3U7_9HELO
MAENRQQGSERAKTPEDRSAFLPKGNPVDSTPKFDVGNSAWITLPRRGSFEVTIVVREKDTSTGKYKYQVKDNDDNLYNEGEWVLQEKLSDCA